MNQLLLIAPLFDRSVKWSSTYNLCIPFKLQIGLCFLSLRNFKIPILPSNKFYTKVTHNFFNLTFLVSNFKFTGITSTPLICQGGHIKSLQPKYDIADPSPGKTLSKVFLCFIFFLGDRKRLVISPLLKELLLSSTDRLLFLTKMYPLIKDVWWTYFGAYYLYSSPFN